MSSAEITTAKDAKTLTSQHILEVITNDNRLSFLKDAALKSCSLANNGNNSSNAELVSYFISLSFGTVLKNNIYLSKLIKRGTSLCNNSSNNQHKKDEKAATTAFRENTKQSDEVRKLKNDEGARVLLCHRLNRA
jgi:hypothetical protein